MALKQQEYLLLRHWYQILADEGFHDLEIIDKKSRYGVSMIKFRRPSLQLGKKYSPAVELFYDLCRAYLHAAPFSVRDYYLWSLYCEGVPYREIGKLMKKRFRYRKQGKLRFKFDLFWLTKRLKAIRSDMFNYHFHNPEGMLHDEYVEENESREISEMMVNNRGVL